MIIVVFLVNMFGRICEVVIVSCVLLLVILKCVFSELIGWLKEFFIIMLFRWKCDCVLILLCSIFEGVYR